MTPPLVDIHCHLLAAMDDGPRTPEDAVEMCRIAYAEGTRHAAAGAHQNERWPAVTPDAIREAAAALAGRLRDAGVELDVFPCAEVMAHPDMVQRWKDGQYLSVADRGKYMLVEMPNEMFVDLRETVQELRRLGVKVILAHPERHPEFLHQPGTIEELIAGGCIVQVSTGSVAKPPAGRDEAALKDWFKRGVVHVLGSDGHSVRRRPPHMAEAYQKIVRWIGPSAAERIGSTNGKMIIQGQSLKVAPPEPRRSSWFAWW